MTHKTEESPTAQAATPSRLGRARVYFLAGLLGWTVLVVGAAATGATTALPTAAVPVPLLLVLGALVGAYARSPRLQAVVAAEDLRLLTAFHGWRIPAGLAFLAYGAQGALPSLFATVAGWGDVIAGGLALGAALLLPGQGAAVRSVSVRRRYVALHAFGMLDFAVAVGTGFTFSLLGHPLMASVQALPLVLIVFVGVPVTGALGLATLHRLLRDTDEELHDQAPVAPPR
jgi:hypothetical protein